MNEIKTQVLLLMRKQTERDYYKNNTTNYSWISYKRLPIKLNLKDEATIRLIAQKLTSQQCYNVIKRLKSWFAEDLNVAANEIPKMYIVMLNDEYTISVIQTITNKRVEHFHHFFKSASNFTPNFVMHILHKIQIKNSG